MEVSALKYFLATAECLSFSEAAVLCHISQSSLSKAIIGLEKELALRLFDRSHHPICLTPAGQSLYASLLRLRPAYQQAMEELKDFSERKTVRCFLAPNSYALKNALGLFAQKNPDIDLQLHTGSNFEIITSIAMSGDYDFTICHQPFAVPEELRITYLYDDELCAVMPKNHRLAGCKEISLSQLNGEILIESPFSRSIVRALQTNFPDFEPGAFFPRADIQITREEVLQRVSRAEGVSIYCGRDVSFFNTGNFSIVRLREVRDMPIVLIEKARDTRPEWHDRFYHYVKETLETYVGPALPKD